MMRFFVKLVIIVICITSHEGKGFPIEEEDGLPANANKRITNLEEAENSETRIDANSQVSNSNFYPSFPSYQNPPLGHSRPYYYQQERAYSHRPQSSYQQQLSYDSPRFSGFKDDNFRATTNLESHGLLGSGNFGVIKGGTFYDNQESDSKNYDRDFSSYFGNSHGGPFYYGGNGAGRPNPRPYQQEQFANFRDFADINTPSNPAYSQFVVVYMNKNGTKLHSITDKPKNIIERLALLELENTNTNDDKKSEKKLSKNKMKLSKLLEKKLRIKKTESVHDLGEPLLALS